MSDNDLIFRGDVLAKAHHHPVDGGLIISAYDVENIHGVKRMMTAVEYARHHGRMCSKAHIFCNNCPIYSANYDCVEFERDYPEEAVAIVEKWAGEHPERSKE